MTTHGMYGTTGGWPSSREGPLRHRAGWRGAAVALATLLCLALAVLPLPELSARLFASRDWPASAVPSALGLRHRTIPVAYQPPPLPGPHLGPPTNPAPSLLPAGGLTETTAPGLPDLFAPPLPSDNSADPLPIASPHSLSDAALVYLTGVLCRYDPQWAAWWAARKHAVPPELVPTYCLAPARRAAHVRREFRAAVAGVQRATAHAPPREVWAALRERLAAVPSAKHHLQLLERIAAPTDGPNSVAPEPATGLAVVLGDGFRPPELRAPSTARAPETGAAFSAADFRRDEPAVAPILAHNLLILAIAGAAAVMITGTLVMPLDIIKVRQQVSQARVGILATGQHILATEGLAGFTRGWGATMLISFFSGAIIFPGVEVGKLWLAARLGAATVARYRVLSVLVTTSFVTALSSVAMIPWERVKIRAIASVGAVPHCFAAMAAVLRAEGLPGVYSGFTTLMTRNLVYMVGKFLVFDYFADAVVLLLGAMPTHPTVLALLSTVKGLLAGTVSVFLSHPPDAVLTRLSQDASPIGLLPAILDIWRHKGLLGFYAGVWVRAAWAAGTVAIQFCIYDSVKALLAWLLLLGVA